MKRSAWPYWLALIVLAVFVTADIAEVIAHFFITNQVTP